MTEPIWKRWNTRFAESRTEHLTCTFSTQLITCILFQQRRRCCGCWLAVLWDGSRTGTHRMTPAVPCRAEPSEALINSSDSIDEWMNEPAHSYLDQASRSSYTSWLTTLSHSHRRAIITPNCSDTCFHRRRRGRQGPSSCRFQTQRRCCASALSCRFSVRPSVQSVSDICLKHICSLDTSAFSALEVLDGYCAIYKSY